LPWAAAAAAAAAAGAAGGGRLGRLGGLLRVRVQLRDGEVPEREPDRTRIQLEHPADVPGRAAAERALVVAVLQNRDGCPARPEHVVIGGDFRHREILQLRLLCRWRWRVPGPFGIILIKVTWNHDPCP